MVTILPSTWRQGQPNSNASRSNHSRISVATILAMLAVGGRVVVAPFLLTSVFAKTSYLSGGKVLIEATDSYFAFSGMDRVMVGGCTGCNRSCSMALLHFSIFDHNALLSKPIFQEIQMTALSPETTLSKEALALGDDLEANNAICVTGFNEWGSPHTVISGGASDILRIITTLQISVSRRMVQELKIGAKDPDKCKTRWTMNSILRRYFFQTTSNSFDYSLVSAADFSVFPDYTECRPDVDVKTLAGSKLVLATNGEDRLQFVPDLVKLFPYDFPSSLAIVPNVIRTDDTIYGARSVTQPLFRAYFAGCRVQEVNSTGIFVEDSCAAVPRWKPYGLMIQAPDELPVCNTENVCIHNYYNSLWEWVTQIDATKENRVIMTLNVFRNRFGDTVEISILPGMVVIQMLLMGIISCYQVMSHKRSVLLTQIWAYRCQNGRMQVLYFAQVTYHLVTNSDVYYLGLATGTLTIESVANLTFCFFAFSYSFVNMLKARSGEQQLARHFRLVWELIQLAMVTCVASMLYIYRLTSLSYIIDANGELLRKTSNGGATMCKLRDSCLVFTHNLALVSTVVSLALGLTASILATLARTCASRPLNHISNDSTARASRQLNPIIVVVASRVEPRFGSHQDDPTSVGPSVAWVSPFTSFEKHCLGVPLAKLFSDCGDIAYMTQKGIRCSTVEAVLLTGFLFYGKHVYRAQDVVILLLARLVPRKIIRTFNVLLLRWTVNKITGRVSFPEACTWYTASEESVVFVKAWPIA